MWVTMIVASMAIVSLAIKVCVWALYMVLIHPQTAFGYLVITVLAGIGVFQLIDRVRG
jgi:hypothetical protein|tara:strand:- start:40 stop:213 length:174 start_codon:yes stop_codon:yes gene_type:complete